MLSDPFLSFSAMLIRGIVGSLEGLLESVTKVKIHSQSSIYDILFIIYYIVILLILDFI